MSATDGPALDDGHLALPSTQEKLISSLAMDDAPNTEVIADPGQPSGGQIDDQQKEDTNTDYNPISAAAADRERAIMIWQSLESEDDVKDVLGRMIGRVEELVRHLLRIRNSR